MTQANISSQFASGKHELPELGTSGGSSGALPPALRGHFPGALRPGGHFAPRLFGALPGALRGHFPRLFGGLFGGTSPGTSQQNPRRALRLGFVRALGALRPQGTSPRGSSV